MSSHRLQRFGRKLQREAIRSGRPVRELIIKKGIMSPADVNIVLNPMNMTKPGIADKKLLRK